MQEITPFLPGDTVAFLRLAEDDRKFPFRPVASGLFLIGEGPGCDLRLGAIDMPPIHSALQTDVDGTKLTRIAEAPDLFLNGEPIEHAILQHGDLIEIGDVRLAFYLCEEPVTVESSEPRSADQLNARELVDGLGLELRILSTDNSRSERITELLKSAQQAVDACQFAQTIRFADYAEKKAAESGASSPDSYLQVLSRLASQDKRLDEICHVLEQVVQQQQMIATALQCVVDRLDDLRSAAPAATLRASA